MLVKLFREQADGSIVPDELSLRDELGLEAFGDIEALIAENGRLIFVANSSPHNPNWVWQTRYIIVPFAEEEEDTTEESETGYNYEGLLELATTQSGVNLPLEMIQGLIPDELYNDFADVMLGTGETLKVTIFDGKFTPAGNIVAGSTVDGDETYITPLNDLLVRIYQIDEKSFAEDPLIFNVEEDNEEYINALNQGDFVIGITAASEYVSEYVYAVIVISEGE